MRQFLGPALLPLAGAGAARQGVPLWGKGQMMQLHALLSQRQPEPPAGLPADEVAVFQDEVDINLNPKIGSVWMRRGQRAVVETPGGNEKRYLAGSMDLRTGTLWMTEGPHRDGELFVRHLEDLRLRLRRYRVMHVICDNAPFHRPEKCKRLQAYPGAVGGSDRAASPAAVRAGNQPHRAGVVAPARREHAQPPVPDDGGIFGLGLRLAGRWKPLCHGGIGLPHPYRRIAHCRCGVEAFRAKYRGCEDIRRGSCRQGRASALP